MPSSRFWLRYTTPAEDSGGGQPDQPAPPAPAPDTSQQPDGPPAEDKQQTFDAEYVAGLRKENAKYRTLAKENAAAAAKLAEIEEASKTEAQKQAEQLQKLQQENAQLKADQVKAQVAEAKGVPARLLVGATREQLEASADELLAFKGQTPPPDFGAGNRGDTPNTLEALDRQIAEAQKARDVPLSLRLQKQRAALAQAVNS